MSKLENRNILVTGSNGNLGPLVTDWLIKEGANVVGTYLNEKSKSKAEERAERSEEVLYFQVDLRENEEVKELRKDIERKFRDLSAIINLVGGFKPGKLSSTDVNQFRNSFERHVTSVFLTVKVFGDQLERNGGSIVNFTSQRALEPSAGALSYSVSKGGVYVLTKALNKELTNVRVNAVAPLTIDVPANRNAMPTADFSRWTKPEEIMDTIGYLISNDAINGQIIRI